MYEQPSRLTAPVVSPKRRTAMKHTPILLAGAALLALSACNRPANEVTDPDADTAGNRTVAAGPPVELPPAIKAEKTLRCKDNSLLYVTFFEGDKQILVRTEPNGAPTTLRTDAVGQPMVAEGGYRLTGSTESVTVTLPGKAEQTCRS